MLRSTVLRRTFIVWVLAVLVIGGAAADERPQYVRLTILHTNDTHGHLLPFSYPDPRDPESYLNTLPALKDIGGAARRATVIDQARGEWAANVLLLDAGDIMDGTPFSVQYTGLADITAMNTIGYDAMVTGNHEYNMSQPQFRKLVESAQFPVICANARLASNNVPILPTRIVFERGGLRVGVFGLTTLESQSYPANRDGIQILDPVTVAGEMVRELEQAQVDVIVALTHIGFDEDVELAKQVPGIDVIVGGHSHTRLPEPQLVAHGEPTAHDINSTVIVQDFQWGGELGRLDLTLYREDDGAYDVMTQKGRLIPITKDIPEDPDVARAVDKYYEPMKPIYFEVLAQATGDFLNSGLERATVNLVADLMREATGADIALQNYGGTRESIVKGPVRMWEVASVLPFNNKLVVMKLTGKRLREGLSNQMEFLGFSNMKVVWGEGGPVSIEVGGESLDDTRVYTAVTTDYIAGKCFADVKDVEPTDMLQRDTIADLIRKKGTISPVLDGRISEAPSGQ
jgi:2',3'-cyclic-nucleotide 2'-phosphodiesterase (5'-nucleotidase family)